jgi:hypothetical protein
MNADNPRLAMLTCGTINLCQGNRGLNPSVTSGWAYGECLIMRGLIESSRYVLEVSRADNMVAIKHATGAVAHHLPPYARGLQG